MGLFLSAQLTKFHTFQAIFIEIKKQCSSFCLTPCNAMTSWFDHMLNIHTEFTYKIIISSKSFSAILLQKLREECDKIVHCVNIHHYEILKLNTHHNNSCQFLSHPTYIYFSPNINVFQIKFNNDSS